MSGDASATSRVSEAEAALMALGRLATSLSFYPEEHPLVGEALAEALPRLQSLASPDGFTIKLIEGEVVWGDQPLFVETPQPGALVGGLVRRGVDSLTFEADVSTEELTVLGRALGEDPRGLDMAGGLSGRLASRGVKHIRADELVTVGERLGTGGGGFAGADARDVYFGALDVIRGAMSAALAGRPLDVQDATVAARTLVERILEDRSAFVGLTCIKGHDQYTFTHSLHICILAVGLGDAAGLESDELMSLGTAALLHDIGKVLVPREILRKPGRLSDEEWAAIARHPVDGAVLLAQYEDLPPEAPVVAYEHHLKPSGGGYPKTERARDLCPFSLMVTIADVYDALTTVRPYRGAMSPVEALATMTQDERAEFDGRLLQWFGEMLGTYPPGTAVELSTGEKAVVCAADASSPQEPLVRVVVDANGKRLAPPPEVRLSEPGERRRIVNALPAEPWGVEFAPVLQEWLRARASEEGDDAAAGA
ncbi:MAG: HD-GYP domain-containing protein [Armatimonadota bacterium]